MVLKFGPMREYEFVLEGARYDKLTLALPEGQDVRLLTGVLDSLNGQDELRMFWAALGRLAGAAGLFVVHVDATSEESAFATLVSRP
jgi:hypothetical protein